MVRSRNRAGFTLVELLVVIGIIAILVGILLPALHKVRVAAYEVACMSNMHQWGLGIQMYVDQNKGFLPQKGPSGQTTASGFGPSSNGNGVIGYDDPSLWFNALPPLVNGKSYYQMLLDQYNGLGYPPHSGDSSIFICPVAGLPLSLDNEPRDPTGNYFLLYGVDSTNTIKNSTGLANQKQFPWAGSYVFNSKLTDTNYSASDNPTIVMSKLKPTSEVVVMSEKIANYGEDTDPTVQKWLYSGATNHLTAMDNFIDQQGFYKFIAQPKSDWTRFSTRHNHGGNILFADGHVAWFAWTQVVYTDSTLSQNSNYWNANQPGTIIWSAVGPVSSSSPGG